MATTAPPAPKETNPHHELGRRGEDLAAKYLESHGLVVLSRNWHCREGELDLVLTDGRHQLVIAEVKTRTGTNFGTPAEAVDDEKARRIRATAHKWLAEFHVPYVDPRFDIVSIIWPPAGRPRIKHLMGAF
jgi:putative endonuclease